MADVEITLIIPSAKVEDFRAGFLAMCPNNETVPDPDYILDPENPNDVIPDVPKYTDKQWFKVWIVRDVKRAYILGKELLGAQATIIDNDVIQ